VSQSLPTKTFRFRIQVRSGSSDWFCATKDLFNQVVSFYFNVIQDLTGILMFPDKEVLTALEQYTHKTQDNPDPQVPLNLGTSIPAMFRRAAINTAIGSSRSFQSNLDRWRKRKAKTEVKGKQCKERPPVPPRTWNYSLVFYAGQWKGFDNDSVLLRLWTGTAWAWIKFRLKGRFIPTGWKLQSPSLVKTGRGWNLHIPTIKLEFTKPLKIVDQVQDPNVKVCSVDLNTNEALAVCVILRPDGTVVDSRFIRGGRDSNTVGRGSWGSLQPNELRLASY
jgi:putative transposase